MKAESHASSFTVGNQWLFLNSRGSQYIIADGECADFGFCIAIINGMTPCHAGVRGGCVGVDPPPRAALP